MSPGYIKETTYQFSSQYPPGKSSNSLVLQSVFQVSSLESKKMRKVPGRSLGGFVSWWMAQVYVKEAAYKFSNLYLPGKCSISQVSKDHHHGV